MSGLRVEIDSRRLRDKLERVRSGFQTAVRHGLDDAADSVVRLLASATREADAHATGRLAKNWFVTPADAVNRQTTEVTIGNRVPYAAAVDQGRAPGKPPPVAAILAWMATVGFSMQGSGKTPRDQAASNKRFYKSLDRAIARDGAGKGRALGKIIVAVRAPRGARAPQGFAGLNSDGDYKDRSAKSVATAIARAIGNRGIPGKNIVESVLDDAAAIVEDRIRGRLAALLTGRSK